MVIKGYGKLDAENETIRLFYINSLNYDFELNTPMFTAFPIFDDETIDFGRINRFKEFESAIDNAFEHDFTFFDITPYQRDENEFNLDKYESESLID